MSTVLPLTIEAAGVAAVIRKFEGWMQKTMPAVELSKTMDEAWPIYENKLAMALFGAFFAGHELCR